MGTVILIIFSQNPHPDAKWFLLGMNTLIAALIGFGAPAIYSRTRAVCKVGDNVIELCHGYSGFRPYGLVHRFSTWYWEDISAFLVAPEAIQGETYRILWILNRAGTPMGCVGLSNELDIELLKQWAESKHRTFETSGSPVANSSTKPLTSYER